MIKRITTSLVITLAFGCQMTQSADGLPIGQLSQDRQVIFSRDVAPVLKKNCVACHNASNEEGGVNLESVQQMKTSDVDDVLVPGKPDASRLFLVASHAEDPVMPPEDNGVSAVTLDPMELALLRRWIESGAVVDQTTIEPSSQTWQPLPPELQTVYGSALTPDGRLSAVSFGNQIQLFGSKTTEPLSNLEIDFGNQTKPAHDDFVQDLVFSPNGRLVVSAGFRNVKLWEMAPLEPTTIPQIDHDDSLAIAMNPSGNHLAVLSRRGELSVAKVGSDRWQWMKSFDLPDAFGDSDSPNVHLAVDAAGHQAAVAWKNTIRVVRIDGMAPEIIDSPNTITAMLYRGNGQLVTADTAGRVFLGQRDHDGWSRTKHDVFDQPIMGLYAATQYAKTHETKRLVAVDVSGRIAIWNEADSTFVDSGQLPTPAHSAALAADGDVLWVATAAGGLGRYNLADKKFVDVAKTDPVAEARYAGDNWQTLVGERLVAMREKAVKQAETNVAAETKSVETLTKEVESKTKQKDDRRAGIADAKKTAEEAKLKLAKSKSTEQSQNQLRKELTESAKQLKAEIAEQEAQLAELQKELANNTSQLSGIPDASKLAGAVKAAADEVDKANQTVAAKESELIDATAALRLAEQTMARGESRLDGLHAEQKHQKQLLDQVKAQQEARETNAAKSNLLRERSRATNGTLAVLSTGTRIVTRAVGSNDETPDAWSLWSEGGEWLAELPGLPTDGEMVAAGDQCVLIKAAEGNTLAFKCLPRLWHHQTTIGASTGVSPFADRVLSLDVDRSGNLLATGGGEPSRSGELMVWNLSDGSLVRSIQKPHDDTVLCVRFSPDGKTLATGGADRMIKLWDVQSGKLINTLEGHTHHVTSLAWNVNGRQLASGSADATVKVWDIETSQATRTINGLKTEVTGLVFVGREQRIGIVGGDGYFRVYRTDNGARETNAKVPGGYLYALDSDREGGHFVVGGADGVAVVVDQSGKQLLKFGSKAD